MKFPSQLRSLCLLGTLLLAPCALLHAQYTNGQDASYVLGQASFTAGTAATTQNGLKTPAGIVVDNSTGKVFVLDTGNNRILRFGSFAATASGSAAEAVLGQANFTTGTAQTTSASALNQPYGAVLDSSGTLWVADLGNNRVVGFTNAATAANGAAATLVLGQANLTSNTAGTTQYSMSGPSSVAIDSTGTLYVMDRLNNRVLRFTNAATKGLAGGAFADGLFGQSNFQAKGTGLTSSTFGLNPWSLTTDSSGNLWVADTANNRVLEFSSPSTAAVGAAASAVLGQSDFVSGGASTSQTGFNAPIGLTFDALGRLYVADISNNRVLVFENSTALSGLVPASFVLGQQNFTSGSSGTTANTLNNPQGLSYSDTGYIWVADQTNNRVLSYAITAGTPALVAHPVKPKIRAGKTKTFSAVLTSTLASDKYMIQASVPKGTTNKASVQFLINGVNVTSALKAGTYETSEILANGSLSISVQIKARPIATGNLKYTLTAASVTDSSNSATTSSTIKVVVPKP